MNNKYNTDNTPLLDDLLLDIPGVTSGKMFTYPGYKVAGKVFAVQCGEGVALKLPKPRVQALLDERADIVPFEPKEGLVWKEWVLLNSNRFADNQTLFDEAIAFVSE